MARFAKVPELPLIVDERQRKGADATSHFTKKLAGPMQVCFGPACFAFSSWGTHEALEQSGLPDRMPTSKRSNPQSTEWTLNKCKGGMNDDDAMHYPPNW